jgi:hypothetical protein
LYIATAREEEASRWWVGLVTLLKWKKDCDNRGFGSNLLGRIKWYS